MNIMWRRAEKVSRKCILTLIIYYITWIGCGIILGRYNDMMAEDVIWILPIVAETYPLEEIKEYQTFCYCRKKQFMFCILGEGIRALIYGGIVRTTIQILFYAAYVKQYTEYAPEEIISHYHQCPIWELLLVNVAIFFLLRLIMVFDSTRKYPVFYFANAFNKKKKPVMSGRRKLLRVIEIPILYIGAIALIMICLGSYDIMLRNTLRDKIGIYLIAFVGIIVFLMIIWRRFHLGKKMEIYYND